MDLVKTKKVLEIMKGVDIGEAGIFAEGDDKNQIRGIMQDKTTIMFTETDRFIEHQVGILSVKGLLSRLTLFDEAKMGVELKTLQSKKSDDEFVNMIILKEGRRRSKVTTTDPSMMKTIPTMYPECETVLTGVITKEYVDYINKMKASINTSISTETLYVEMFFESDDETSIGISIGGGYDDFDDRVDAEIEPDYVGKSFSVQWKIDPFIRAMRQAASSCEDDDIVFKITDMGFLEIDVDGVIITVAPMNVTKPH